MNLVSGMGALFVVVLPTKEKKTENKKQKLIHNLINSFVCSKLNL